MKRLGGRRHQRTVVLAIIVALLVSACAGDGGNDEENVGTSLDTTSSSAPSSSSSSPPSTAETTTSTQATMPDVIGLTESEARSALLADGVRESDIVIDEQESLEPAGTVIESVPSSGGRITGSVNLLIAVPVGDVPDFIGQQVSAVREWATDRGITVTEEAIPDDSAPEGQIIETTPRPGEVATSEILVRYATNPLVVPLADIEFTNDADYCYSTEFGIEASVNGEFQQDSIAIEPSEDSSTPCVLEYNLGRDWTRLKATVGIEDSSDTEARYRVQVLGDDNELWNNVLSFAEPQALDVDMTNILRLKVIITTLVTNVDGRAVLGDVRLIGDEATVPSTTSTTS
ncbi:MAG TPA: PASTA domain-containing protein [Acidimicrobiales bacterium]|jgi:hypothetical protein